MRKNTKSAWTMVELTIALTILIIISFIGLSNFKPNVNKARLFMYATMKNIYEANNIIVSKYITEGSDLYQANVGTNDWYCVHLAEIFTLKDPAVCKTTTADNVSNMTLPNGVTLKGVAKDWVTPYVGATWTYKDIIIDIDGDKGMNKLWADQFLVRIYGSGDFKGRVFPADCGTYNVAYNGNTKVTLTKSVYCGTNTAGLVNLNEIVSYDLFRAKSAEENTTGFYVATNLSLLDADCRANGGSGLYGTDTCKGSNARRLDKKCVSDTTCAKCAEESGVCPCKNDDCTTIMSSTECTNSIETANDGKFNCNVLQHKPQGGSSFILNTVFGDIFE